MKEKILVICDNDREYVSRLGRYIAGRADPAIRVACFSERDKFLEYARNNPIDSFLVGEDWVSEEICPDRRRWMVFSDETTEETRGECPKEGTTANTAQNTAEQYRTVSRYQAADVIFARVLQAMKLPGRGRSEAAAEAFLVGIYTPSGWPETARLALALTGRLGREGPAVYVGLGEFSAVRRITDNAKDQDLSDVAYCFRRGSLTYDRLERMTVHQEGFDCIPAPTNPAELAELTGTELAGLLEAVRSVGGYQYLVVDFGGSISGRLSLFESCGKTIVLFTDSEEGRLQREEFEAFWKAVGARDLLDRTELLMLPTDELRTAWRGKSEGYVNELAGRLLRDKRTDDPK